MAMEFKGMTALALIVGASVFAGGPASAHHAINSQFDVTALVPKSGVLTSVDNINPHVYWHFDVKNADGKFEQWNIESVAPNGLRRAGISMKDDVAVGTTYNFQIAPARNGGHTGLLMVIEVKGKSVRLVAE
jgi:hypothetical protein